VKFDIQQPFFSSFPLPLSPPSLWNLPSTLAEALSSGEDGKVQLWKLIRSAPKVGRRRQEILRFLSLFLVPVLLLQFCSHLESVGGQVEVSFQVAGGHAGGQCSLQNVARVGGGIVESIVQVFYIQVSWERQRYMRST